MATNHTDPSPFSQELDTWLRSKTPKTVAGLQDIVAEKSFAIIFLVLMIVPALPLPTGGATHVFEVIVIILVAQMIAGRTSVWLPQRLAERPLGTGMLQKGIPTLIRLVRWFERFSRPRGGMLLTNPRLLQLIGLVILGFTVSAFMAVPLSGLDTLPSLGVVLISLSLILEDIVLTIAGLLIGCIGIALSLTLGAALAALLKNLL